MGQQCSFGSVGELANLFARDGELFAQVLNEMASNYQAYARFEQLFLGSMDFTISQEGKAYLKDLVCALDQWPVEG